MNKGFVVAGLVVVACLAITGCQHPGIVAMKNMNSSKDNYKDCLKAFPGEPSKCETQRRLFEVDRDAVEATTTDQVKVK
jgi:hypothetical protein